MKDPNDEAFVNWIISHKTRSFGICITIALEIIGFFYYRFSDIKYTLDSKWFSALWFGIHLVVIVILFGCTYVIKPRTSEKYVGISKAVKDFHNILFFLWVVWAALYCALTYQAFGNTEDHKNLRIEAKNVESAMRTYFAKTMGNDEEEVKMNVKTISEALKLAAKYQDSQGDSKNKSLLESAGKFREYQNNLKAKSLETLINFINNLQSLAMILLFWVLAFPRELREIFLITIVSIIGTFAFALVDKIVDGSMGILIGIFGGIAMALWVGRLDSKFLKVPFGAILALYSYAILQVTWFVYQYDDEKILIITGLAMIFKIVVYLVCSWILEDGRLLYFCAEMRLLYGEAKEDEGISMLGEVSVDKRRKAFLDSLRGSEEVQESESEISTVIK